MEIGRNSIKSMKKVQDFVIAMINETSDSVQILSILSSMGLTDAIKTNKDSGASMR